MTEASKAVHESLVDFNFAEMFIDKAPTQWEQIIDPVLENLQKK